MTAIIRDDDLMTIADITNRINSIDRQIDKEESKDISKLKNWRAHNDKVIKLQARKESLHCRRAILIKQQQSTT